MLTETKTGPLLPPQCDSDLFSRRGLGDTGGWDRIRCERPDPYNCRLKSGYFVS